MKVTSDLTNLTTAILILTVQMFIEWTLLFRTRNLSQQFFDISKKNYVNQSLMSLINDNLKITLKFFL
jgi:hypothetical protein